MSSNRWDEKIKEEMAKLNDIHVDKLFSVCLLCTKRSFLVVVNFAVAHCMSIPSPLCTKTMLSLLFNQKFNAKCTHDYFLEFIS